MIRKLLVLGYVLGVACTLYIGVEDENGHRIKGKVVRPTKRPSTRCMTPKCLGEEPPDPEYLRQKKISSLKEELFSSSRISIIFKKEKIKDTEELEKWINKLKQYGVIHDTFSMIDEVKSSIRHYELSLKEGVPSRLKKYEKRIIRGWKEGLKRAREKLQNLQSPQTLLEEILKEIEKEKLIDFVIDDKRYAEDIDKFKKEFASKIKTDEDLKKATEEVENLKKLQKSILDKIKSDKDLKEVIEEVGKYDDFRDWDQNYTKYALFSDIKGNTQEPPVKNPPTNDPFAKYQWYMFYFDEDLTAWKEGEGGRMI